MLERVATAKAPSVGFSGHTAAPLSQAVVVGELIYCSGTGPLDPETRSLVSDSFDEQVQQTLTNLLHVVEAAGGDKDTFVKCNVFLGDVSKFAEFNALYRDFFSSCDGFPARTTVGATLHRPGVQIEIECVATKA